MSAQGLSIDGDLLYPNVIEVEAEDFFQPLQPIATVSPRR